jgi:hypothetical protein
MPKEAKQYHNTTTKQQQYNTSRTKKKKKLSRFLKYLSVASKNPSPQSVFDHLFSALKRHDTHSNYKQFLGALISSREKKNQG